METTFHWEDKTYRLQVRSTARTLFWGLSATLSDEALPVLTASGAGIRIEAEEVVHDADQQPRRLHLSLIAGACNPRYDLRVDGKRIASGSIWPKNAWYSYPLIWVQAFGIGAAVAWLFGLA